MPVHDWTQVDAGIFHDFHHAWIEELKRALNGGVLPSDYYALAEQHAAGWGPDVLALQGPRDHEGAEDPTTSASTEGGGTALLAVAAPALAPTAETDGEFYRRKQTPVVVRHVSGDRIVAMIEVVSPGNKSSAHAMRKFVEKASELLLDREVHLLILDLHPPGPRDPRGIHAAIWDEVAGQPYEPTAGLPLTVAAYEADLAIRAYVQPVAAGQPLPDMPLFLEPKKCVQAPLEATYQAAFAAMPRRWRSVLEPRR